MQQKSKTIFTLISLLALIILITGGVIASSGDTPQTVDELSMQQIAKSASHADVMSNIESVGVARLIVEVKAAKNFVGIAGLSGVEAQSEMDKVSAAQANFAAEFPSLAADMATLRTIPVVSVWVTSEAEYAALLASSSVLSVQFDFPKKVNGVLDAPLAMPDANTFMDTQVMWNAGYDGTGKTIAILDTGVDSTHDFLDAGKVVAEFCHSTEYAPYFATPLCNGGVMDSAGAGEALPYIGNCPAGECDHGTHVAGIAAGTDPSFSGIAPDATLIAAQVFTRFDWDGVCGTGGSPCVASFDYDQMLAMEDTIMLALGIHSEYPGLTLDVASLNMSLGGGYSYTHCDEEESARKDLIDTLKSLGTATVISAGNDGYTDSTSYPGCVSTAFTIGATFNEAYSAWVADDIAPFSNAQASILDMWAPGVFVESSIPVVSGPGGGVTNPTEEYHGTSMSAPMVAGAFALFEEANPSLGVDDVFSIMHAAGVELTDDRALPEDPPTIAPRLDFTNALTVVAGPTLISPADGTITYNGLYPTFEWAPVAGVDSYTFEYSEDNSFATSTQEMTDVPLVGYDELPVGVYYWRVKSTTGAVDSSWSPTWTFIVNPLDTPTLVAPVDPAKTNDLYPTFEWSAVDGATGYVLELSLDDLFTSPWWKECATTSCQMDAALPAGTWYWRVKATNDFQDSTWSSSWRLTIGVPIINGPIDGVSTTDHTPNFDWEDFPGAVSYVIQVSPTSDFSALPINHTVTNSFFAPGIAMINQMYYWRVVANTGGQLSDWSEVRTITITGAPGNAQPQVIGPDDGATLTDRTPTFDWEDVPTAVRYRFQMSLTEGFGVWIVNQTITDSEFTPGVEFNDGTYYWRVQAEGGGDTSWFSARRSFTIAGE
jgi:hypothetical protein